MNLTSIGSIRSNIFFILSHRLDFIFNLKNFILILSFNFITPVMRVRATRGIRITNFYGNYLLRGTDLLALPNCTADSSFAVDLGYDEVNLLA